MAKMTLLDLVQDIINDLDGDEINSINDTIESSQVAQIVKSTYMALVSNRNWPHLKRLLQIVPSGSSLLPTHMSIQTPIKELSFINYDKARLTDAGRRIFQPVKWLEQDDFLRVVNGRNNLEANVFVVTDPQSQVPLNIRNDIPPTYYTSFDDNTLIFDSYDSLVDNTLQASKTQAYGYIMPEWSPTDTFIPDLPTEAFTLLLEESKSRASLKLRQQPDQKAEQESVRQNKWLSRKAWRVHGGIIYPNYGRSGKNYRDPTFRRDRE